MCVCERAFDRFTRSFRVVGVEQLSHRCPRHVGPGGIWKISAARSENVTRSVAASQLQSPSFAAASARLRRSASEYRGTDPPGERNYEALGRAPARTIKLRESSEYSRSIDGGRSARRWIVERLGAVITLRASDGVSATRAVDDIARPPFAIMKAQTDGPAAGEQRLLSPPARPLVRSIRAFQCPGHIGGCPESREAV